MSFGFAIGDVIAVGQLAWTLYRDCYTIARGAPQEFQLLLGEISTLSNSIKILKEEVEEPSSTLRQAGEDRVRMVNKMLSRINVTLKEIQKVGRKYEILGTGSKRQQIWVKFKWSVEFTSIDSLRSKLVYHNTVMNLLLTSVGNSSLKRIESSTKALETDVTEIKGYIRASSRNTDNQSSRPPLVSIVDDEVFKISLSTVLMKNAETLQPWSAIGADRWIQAGRWWLLKSQMELYATPVFDSAVPLPAYINLIKASWILIDIITCHPQLSFLNSSTHYEVHLLSAELKKEFKMINDLKLAVPGLCDLEDQNLEIWETQARGPLLRPRNSLGKLDPAQIYSGLWTVEGEQAYFQRFGFYRRHSLAESLTCIVLFLVHKKTHIARIVVQDQNGNALMEVAIQLEVDAHAQGSCVTIGAENIILSRPADAECLCSIIEAAKLYFFGRSRDHVNLDDFKGFILMVAVKNEHRDAVMQILESPTSSMSSFKSNKFGDALPMASTLASQFIRCELNDGLHENSKYDKSQVTLFSWAAQCGYTAIVQLLLEEKVDVKDDKGWTALHLAAKNGHKAVVHLLVEKGANVDAKDEGGWTVLHLVAKNGYKEAVQLLIDNGANVDTKDEGGWTALHLAARNGLKETVQLLIKNRASVDAKDKRGWTALHRAAENGHKAVVHLLVEKGANVNAAEEEGQTVLHLAAGNGLKEAVHLLVEKGANVNVRAKGGWTALHLAAGNGHKEAVQLLFEKGANVGAESVEGWTALHLAAKNGHTAVVHLLVDKGANVDVKGAGGWTALHLAAENGLKEAVQLLVEKGANVNAESADGLRALHLAAKNEHNEVVRLLTF